MIDKIEVQIPFSASFRPEFRFVTNELRYAGVSSIVQKSQYYQGTCDLRPFKLDAIAHIHARRSGQRNHKLEILDSGEKSIPQIAEIIEAVFDVDSSGLRNMRIDFAADMYGIPVLALHGSMRAKFKRTSDEWGERDYQVVGGRRLEYFRYGKAPNCIRAYDKPAECKARLKGILKRANKDAEPPTFEDIFGFPESTVMSRIERQAGGGRIPEVLATFGQLYRAAEYDPFTNLELIENEFVLPDPKQSGDARSLKLAGISRYIQMFGRQQARAMLNSDGNAKRYLDDYDEYLRETAPIVKLKIEDVVGSYQNSVRKQIDGSITKVAKKYQRVESANQIVAS